MAGTTYTVTNSFSADTTAIASQVNANFTDILTAINALNAGNLTSGTIALARISGLTVTQLAAATLVLESEGIESNDNDTTWATCAAIKDAYDTADTANIGTAGQYHYSGAALNSGNAVAITTAGTYVTVATGLSNRALCYIKMQNVSGAGWASCIVRDKDETGNWGHVQIDFPSGPARCELTNNYYGAVIVPCNADGDIEITSGTNGDDWKLWLMGYIQ